MNTFDSLRSWGTNLLRGEQVILRPVQPTDTSVLAAWWNDTGEAILQQDRIAPRPTHHAESLFDSWSSNESPGGFGYAIEDQQENLVGHITAWGLGLPVRIATLGIVIGPEYQDHGYGRDAMTVALRLLFEEMGANKVELRAWEYNARALALYSSLGFVEEGRRRAATLHRSKFYDQVELGMLREEYAARGER
ncbi:GNAT family N-acetyltransferase [Corynebacterium oculi]|uniref:Acetyltransferase (GNAT) family protein n=1 Tax=Corynebacterium oculi TaxID=1544416 RepID=A0A0Q0U7K3_9CORY|nr:GNAT family protein [Corynebacterium oculi]KQB83374.1 Acetyltransferase (GNAT) family protein [Corynebacterium oculi]